jgi:alanine transaminase
LKFVAGCTHPGLMNTPDFPSDIKQRVEHLLSSCHGKSLGSYTDSQGIRTVREDIADYIERRDGHPANPNDIYLCNGATEGIKVVLKLLMNNDLNKPSGIVSEIFC